MERFAPFAVGAEAESNVVALGFSVPGDFLVGVTFRLLRVERMWLLRDIVRGWRPRRRVMGKVCPAHQSRLAGHIACSGIQEDRLRLADELLEFFHVSDWHQHVDQVAMLIVVPVDDRII
jgi:hypothetical protein